MKISEELKAILLIQKDCPVSQKILDLEMDTDEFINGIGYLSIAYDNPSLLSYITKDRTNRFFKDETKEVFDRKVGDKISLQHDTPFVSDGNILWNLAAWQTITVASVSGNCIDIFAYKHGRKYRFDDCNLFYFNPTRVITKVQDFWDKELRIKHAFMARSGKVLNKLFNEGLFSKLELEAFSRIFFSNNNPLGHRGLKFRIVNGDDIRHYYHHNQYEKSGNGSLNGSCMRHDDCQEFFGIYTNNDNVEMLIMEDSLGLIHGRALLWHNVTIGGIDGYNFMDRIYTSNSNDEICFKNWAIENNYAYKSDQSTGDYGIAIDGEFAQRSMAVRLNKVHFDYYPYVDTFTYIDRYEKIIVSNSLQNQYDTLSMTNHERGVIDEEPEPNTVYSDYEGRDIEEDDSVWSNYHNSYLTQGNSTYSRYYDDYISDDVVIEVKISGKWQSLANDDYDKFETCYIDDVQYGIDEMFYCEVDDNWYHESHISQCEFDKESYPNNLMVEASDGCMIYEGNIVEYEESIKIEVEEMEEVNG